MARTNADALSAIAGMFIFLPGVLSGWALPDPAPPADGAKEIDVANANLGYIATHWPVLTLSALVVAYGSLALLALLLHPSRPTVAGALRLGLVALPFYTLAWVVQSLVVLGGFMLFILPGLYMAARFLCVAAIAVAEERRGAFAILMRSFQLTHGNGLRIVLLLVVMAMVYIVASVAFRSIIGIGSMLLLPPDVARFVIILAGGVVQTMLAVAVTIVGASVYRQTSAARPFS